MAREKIDLSSAEDKVLWLDSGGMCAICKKKLILDDVGDKVNIGERAHIIGKGTTGPRREFMEQYGYKEETLDDLSNLMLLCKICHKKIDSNEKNYPPEMLFKIKADHENMIRKRLEINGKSIVVIHKRKDGPIDHISLSSQIDSILIDAVSLQDEFTNFSQEGWQEAKRVNEDFYKNVMEVKKKYDGTMISIFSLSPIPLLIHFGKLVSDSVPVEIYQYDRSSQTWVRSENNGQIFEQTEVNVNFNQSESNILVITMEISSRIRKSDIAEILDQSYNHVNISVGEPKIDAILYNKDVIKIKEKFREQVLYLQQKYDFKEIHLFYAGPAGLAVELGRCINEEMFPHLHLYHFKQRESPKYHHAFVI